jgi:hypothetical protein
MILVNAEQRLQYCAVPVEHVCKRADINIRRGGEARRAGSERDVLRSGNDQFAASDRRYGWLAG